jgi:hypothetical protein
MALPSPPDTVIADMYTHTRNQKAHKDLIEQHYSENTHCKGKNPRPHGRKREKMYSGIHTRINICRNESE